MNELLIISMIGIGLGAIFGIAYPVAVIIYEKAIKRNKKPIREIMEDY